MITGSVTLESKPDSKLRTRKLMFQVRGKWKRSTKSLDRHGILVDPLKFLLIIGP